MSYLIAQILSCFSWSFYSYSKPCICIHICISITKSLKNKESFTHTKTLHMSWQPKTRPSVFYLYILFYIFSKQQTRKSAVRERLTLAARSLLDEKQISRDPQTSTIPFPDRLKQRLLGKNISTTPDTQRDRVQTSWVTPFEKEEVGRRKELRRPLASSVWDKHTTRFPVLTVPA